MAIDYLDFDLAIEAIESTPSRYRARVLSSPAGEASAEFVLPFAPLELENYILTWRSQNQTGFAIAM